MSQTSAGDIVINLKANLVDFKAGMTEGSAVASRATKQLSSEIKSEMTEAKGGLMLVEESIGIHIPRHLNALIAQIPGVGALFANMLPLIGVAAAITIIVELIEHHQALKDAMEVARKSWKDVDDTAQKSLENTRIKMLEIQKTVDELHQNHLAALKDQLKLIDMQTFTELGGQFDALVKKADEAFTKIEAGWVSKVASFLFGEAIPAQAAKKDFDSWAESWKDGGMQADALKKKLDELYAAKDRAMHPSAEEKFIPSPGRGVPGRKMMVTPDVNPEEVDALQHELDILQHLQTAQTSLNQLRDDQKGLANEQERVRALTEQQKIADRDLSNAKTLGDAKIKLAADQAQLTELQTKDATSRVATITEASIAQEEAAQETAANQKYQNDVDYWNKILASHKTNSDKDREETQRALATLSTLDVEHQDEIVRIQVAGQAKLNALKKQVADDDLRAQQEDLRREQQNAKEKFDAQNTYFQGVEQHIKSLQATHAISGAEEVVLLKAVYQQEYEAELAYLDTKVKNAAREMVIEASKNGQILTMDDALIKAKQNLDNEYVKAKTKLDNADTAAADAHQKELLSVARRYSDQFTSTIADQLAKGKADWQSYFQSIEAALIKLALNALFKKLLGGLSFGGFSVGDIFRAGGGGVNQDQPYIVGEKQPELFVPDRPGVIIPQVPVSGSGTASVQNFYNRFEFPNANPDSFRASQSQVAAAAAKTMSHAARRN